MADDHRFSSGEFLSHLIRGMAEGVIFIDDKNIVRLCNPVGSTLMGVKSKELLDNDFLKCHPKSVYESVLNVVEDLKTGRKKGEKRVVKIKGRLFEHAYSAVRDLEGNYLGTVSVSRDVTERVLLEMELKEYNEKLERSNSLKDLFSDILRHDFINPASIIKNSAEFLLDEKPSDEAAESVSLIKRNADRLLEMIDNATRYSKLEDSADLSYIKKDLSELVKKTIDEFQPQLDEKGIDLKFNPDGAYFSEVSPFIEDVFINLISNAIKYSPNKSVVSIEIRDEGENLLISVSDQAERIPEEYRTSIFERFKRVGKEGVKGSGLGLAIVKRVIELHHGRVWVEENPDGGNIFYVEIPKKSLKEI